MTLYDENGLEHTYNITELHPIGKGYCGVVYQLDEKSVLKIYNAETEKFCRLNKEVAEVSKTMKNPHLMNIQTLLYREPKIDKNSCQTEAYIASYIKKDNIDILRQPTDYLLENMYEISKLFDQFTAHNITVDDVKFANARMQENNIVLVDIDTWKNIKTSPAETKRINNTELLLLFKRIVQSTIVLKNYPNDWFYTASKDLFDMDKRSIGEIEVTDIIAKRLVKYKYPIDYFKN